MKHQWPQETVARPETKSSYRAADNFTGKSDSSLRLPISLAYRFRLRLFNYAVDNDGKNETKNMQLTWIPKLSPMRIKKQNKRWKIVLFSSRGFNMNFCNRRVIYIFLRLVNFCFVSLVSRVLNFK